MVYLIKADPEDKAVISPVIGSMLATNGESEDQVPPGKLEVNFVAPGLHIAAIPLKLPGFGGAVTVTDRLAETSGQPPVPRTV